MRRKISLYIADNLVDLDDQSLILFNYTMEDLLNPTIVKNSYSHQITIKGTPNNNRLFGDIFRLDRVVTYNGGTLGTDFNPSQKTPFVIYNEMGEILERGYCKLDSVTRKKGEIEYQISLFGGLGSFLYSLAYDAEGNKRSLASLDYLGTGNTDTELDFTINADNVAAAWNTDSDTGNIDSIWKVINFAPAYNGIPEGKFAADKALVVPSQVGLKDEITEGTGADAVKYGLKNGYAMVNLSQKYDEWSVKDLRSYLQRPVFSMRAFLEAIKKPLNNGGYVVNMPFLEKLDFNPYGRLWMTLPLIPSIGTTKQTSGDLTLTLSSTPTTNHQIGRFTIGGSVPFGTKVTTNVNVKLQYSVTGATDAFLLRSSSKNEGRNTLGKQSVIFLQLVAHGSDDSIVGGSRVKSIFSWRRTAPSAMANTCGYIPPFVNGDETFELNSISESTFNKVGSVYQFAQELGFYMDVQDVSYYELHVTTYVITTYKSSGGASSSGTTYRITGVSGGSNSLATLYRDYDTAFVPASAKIAQGDNPNSITYTSAESLRSGAHITKSMLLSTSQSPADYLLSFCKIFGLHILFDKSTNEITIIDRNDLYQDETIDLTRRVDISRNIDIIPFVFTSKWYDLKLEGVGGAFFDEYRSVHGFDYGIQRINTGYDFNAETKNLLEGNVFKNAATILDKSKYYTTIKVGGQFRPSVFLDQGHTYTLWNTAGETLDTPVPVPPYSAVIDYLNEYGNPGYDVEFARKMEFRSRDGKPVDATNVLMFWEGYNTYDYFNLSDDVPAMDLLNEGVPCWILNPGSSAGLRIPIFQRYVYGREWTIKNSLDFGIPSEMDIPQITYKGDATIYSKFWKNYLRDRYDVNTKVMTCRVNFGGLQVGQDLLRKFFWFDNSLWVLNKISNYSLTTYDPVECEFVQVQDKNNYLNGQY